MRGYFVIERTSVTRSEFFSDGTARKLEFTMNLKRVDDDESSLGNKLLGRTIGGIASRLGISNIVGTVGNKIGGML